MCCDTQVFIVKGTTAPATLNCPSCGRHLPVAHVAPFGDADWQSCADPRVMIQAAGHRLTDRKRQLFACACCRLVWDQLTDPRSRTGVELAERLADKRAVRGEVARVRQAAASAALEKGETHPAWAALETIDQGRPPSVEYNLSRVIGTILGWRRQHQPTEQSARVAAVVRDLVANPFRPPPAPLPATVLAWDGGTVARLARVLYDERGFDRLPILADALEEAGCTDVALLAHCRSPGPHVLGCWAVDQCLGLG
jgi:hypothetical protein